MSAVLPVSPSFQQAIQQLTDERPPLAAAAIYSSQGIKLIDQGAQVDPKLYERLMRHQLAQPLEFSLQAQDSVNGKFLRTTAESLIGQQPILAYMLDKQSVRAILLDALESTPLPAPIAFQLSVARDVHPSLLHYCVCTALIAGWLGAGPQALRYDVQMLVAGGLLQDLGMLHVDPVLLQAEGPLTHGQRRQLYSHPLVSALLLERHHEYPRELIRAVREHHEMLDGSGYPAGLVDSKISAWGRVLSLAQVVAALLRPGREHPYLRLSLLLRTNRHQFDQGLSDRVLTVVQRQARDSGPATPTQLASLMSVVSPARKLIAMDQLLTAWPAQLAEDASATAVRRAGMVSLGQQCETMRRLLAEAGVNAEQLRLLEDDFEDEVLASEMSLIAQEMAWQLRRLTRQTGRLWPLAAGEALPAPLADWLRQVQDCIADLVEI